MKRIGVLLVAIAAAGGVVAAAAFTSQPADDAATTRPPIFGGTLPSGYRDWRLISVAREEGKLDDIGRTVTALNERSTALDRLFAIEKSGRRYVLTGVAMRLDGGEEMARLH